MVRDSRFDMIVVYLVVAAGEGSFLFLHGIQVRQCVRSRFWDIPWTNDRCGHSGSKTLDRPYLENGQFH